MRAPRALVALSLTLLAGCDGPARAAGSALPSASSEAAVTRVAVVGDSISEADSPDFDAGDLGPSSWTSYAGGDGVVVLGGWAHSGATTADMLAGVADEVASGAPQAPPDVLVLMGGNNDVDAGVSYPGIARNLVAVAGLVRAHRVLLSTLAPEDEVAAGVAAVNAELPGLAQQHGWQLVDPMGGVGDGAGHYLPGMTDDGVHPTAAGARLIGAALHEALAGQTAQ